MIVYEDILTGDEVCTSAFNPVTAKDEDGNEIAGLLMIESKNVPKSGGDIDIGCGNAFGGDDDAGESDVEMVNNVVDSFQLTISSLSSATEFKGWIKEYMQNVVAKLKETISDVEKRKEKIQSFKAQAADIAKYLVKNFKELEFYLTASFNPESMVFSMYPEGALTPNFYIIEGGTKSSKF